MENRIIKDIRYYQLNPKNYTEIFDGILGNGYKSSFEIRCIGQRIARKLNEFKFITGNFDHLYVFLTNKIDNGLIEEYEYEYDKQIRCFNFGQNQEEFNNYSDNEREEKITAITFNILKWTFGHDEKKKTLIDSVEGIIQREGKETIINFKEKETKKYKINIGFQIAPFNEISTVVVNYLSKKDNVKKKTTIDLFHYEDIYDLVDKIFSDEDKIIFQPKKTFRADIVCQKYTTPLTINVNELTPI